MKHQLPKLALLQYALDGAITWRGLNSGNLEPEEENVLDKDIAEIRRRIKLVEAAERRKS